MTRVAEKPAEGEAAFAGLLLHHEVSQFLYREAQLQDDHDYRGWEALWADDAIYWVPANGTDIDPEHQMSIVYDNRSRISVRVNQLCTGNRHAAEPRSAVRRTVSNIEVRPLGGDEYEAVSNATIFESNLRGDQLWSTRNIFLLRRTANGGWRMARKTVLLTNNDKPLWTISFLI